MVARWLRRGIIPAHAGKTKPITFLKRLIRDHPRSRGENPHVLGVRVKKEGSSPLTRGKLNTQKDKQKCERIIPAHAGKTFVPLG